MNEHADHFTVMHPVGSSLALALMCFGIALANRQPVLLCVVLAIFMALVHLAVWLPERGLGQRYAKGGFSLAVVLAPTLAAAAICFFVLIWV